MIITFTLKFQPHKISPQYIKFASYLSVYLSIFARYFCFIIKNDPPAKPGRMCGQSRRMPAAPSQAHRRSGLCAGLSFSVRERRALLLLATLKRGVVLPKHRHRISQLLFVQLVSDVDCNLLFVLPYKHKGWGSGVGENFADTAFCFS